MKFEILDVVSQADIIVLFDGESYENLHDGFMIKSSDYQRSGNRPQDIHYHAKCIRDAYASIRYVYNAQRRLVAKRKNRTSTLVDVRRKNYAKRRKIS